MEDDSALIVIIFMIAIAVGLFFMGKTMGESQWKKPCDQFTRYQYQAKIVPERCVK